MTPILLPLYVDPSRDPAAWRAAAELGRTATVVVDAPGPPTAALARAGVRVLARVDLDFATRPVDELESQVRRWARDPATGVRGVFLDQAPTSPFSFGPVARAARAARRAGLATVVLHPGVPTDRLYRRLQLPVCTFEGSWEEYQRWDGAGSFPGDGHLVHSVPAAGLAGAWALLRERAGWGLVTDRCPPAPYAGAPGWLLAPRQDQPDPPSLRPSALR